MVLEDLEEEALVEEVPQEAGNMFFQCTFCPKMFIIQAEADKHIRGHMLKLRKDAKAGKARIAEEKRRAEEARKREEERDRLRRERAAAHNKKLEEHKKKHSYLMRNCETCSELIKAYQQNVNGYYNPFAKSYYSQYSSVSTYMPTTASPTIGGAGGNAGGVIDMEEQGDNISRITM